MSNNIFKSLVIGKDYEIYYDVTSSGCNKYKAKIRIKNLTKDIYKNWKLMFTFKGEEEVELSYNCKLFQKCRKVEIIGMECNSNINSCGEIVIGFLYENPCGSGDIPKDFSLSAIVEGNGESCGANEQIQFAVNYSVVNQWSNGFEGSIVVKNVGTAIITPWVLTFDFPNGQNLNSAWNCEGSQIGTKVSMKNPAWNDKIAPGDSVTIGFSASYCDKNDDPKKFYVNGVPETILYGNVLVNVDKPSFSTSIFTPVITVGDSTATITWGGSQNFKMRADKSYIVTASAYNDGKYIYKPSVSPSTVTVNANETTNVKVNYTQDTLNPDIFCGYFPSWSDRYATTGSKTDLGNLPSYVNRVIVAFAKPDMSYDGTSTTNTGLEFNYDSKVMKEAITYLKQRNPETKVLLSVGGATYTNWEGYNPKDIARFVKDFNFDGVDIDFEPTISWGCKPDATGQVHCVTDKQYISLITEIRAELPKPYLISAAPFSVGAYGEGQWKDAPPANLASTGMFLDVMREVGDKLDIVNAQGYNAGISFNPLQATQAYGYYFKGQTAMGIMVPPEDWGTRRWTVEEIESVGKYIKDNNIGGMMLWELYRKTGTADSQVFASAIAKALGFPNYSAPLFPLHNPGVDIVGLEPNKPEISLSTGSCPESYTIKVVNYGPMNGDMCKLYQNGLLIDTQALVEDSPNIQRCEFFINCNPKGIYSYTVDLSNKYGNSMSQVLIVNTLSGCSGN